MMIQLLEILFWVALAIVLYTYIGYGIVAWVWARWTAATKGKAQLKAFQPPVTVVVPAYNEASILREKIDNCFALDYPKDRLQIMFITDGSTDESAKILAEYPQVQHLHSPVRGGKSMA
ncbi:MAG: glycosyltransferase, partial [Hymenobacteraceae bacterium]|nr:glycosyltransferase [Hymenobacteraceae bacterium]